MRLTSQFCALAIACLTLPAALYAGCSVAGGIGGEDKTLSSSESAAGVGGAGGGGGAGAGVYVLPASGSGGAGGQGGGGGEGGVGGAGGVSESDAGAPEPPCPPDMAHIDAFCMDRYEAPNIPGAKPFVMESAISAGSWCGKNGKRLCTEDEWVRACMGSEGTKYPYGDTHETSRCNDDKKWKYVDEQTLATWPSVAAQAEVDKLWQGAPSGSYPGCASDHGVYDLTGNIEEWVVRTKPHANNYAHLLVGCYWAGCYGGNSPSCASANPNHGDSFKFYETGFRCCADAKVEAE